MSRPRSPGAIADRAAVLCVTALRAQGLDRDGAASLLARLGAADAVTSAERLVVFLPAGPEGDAAHRLLWNYEASWTLLWLIGHVRQLGPLDSTCDADHVIRTFTEAESTEHLAAGGRRPAAQAAAAEADRTAAAVARAKDAIRAGDGVPEGILFPVACQRHLAFGWALDEDSGDWEQVTRSLERFLSAA
ncbi:MAG TPA: DUF4272 domain-containing protein [Solirubrobacteraceae bacterium]|nr:DUF4272 domain-containing protein [Solirubrobacteraceae bacterium]